MRVGRDAALLKDTPSRRLLFKPLPYLRSHSSFMFDLLADPRRLLGDAVGVEAVDFVLDAQSFGLLVFVRYN